MTTVTIGADTLKNLALLKYPLKCRNYDELINILIENYKEVKKDGMETERKDTSTRT